MPQVRCGSFVMIGVVLEPATLSVTLVGVG
jgi:hypothetical protein